MKKVMLVVLALSMLCGCSREKGNMQEVYSLRKKLQGGNGCAFHAKVTADYGDGYYQFEMDCKADSKPNVEFTVTYPESICGISGVVESGSGKLIFDNTVLAFDTLADGYISPVTAAWVMVNSLISGYITSCGEDDVYLRVALDDSYEAEALHLDSWLDKEGIPVRCEILYKGRRYLTIDVSNFTFL